MGRERGAVQLRHNPLFSEPTSGNGLEDRSGPTWSAVGKLNFANPAFRADAGWSVTPCPTGDGDDALPVLDAARVHPADQSLAMAVRVPPAARRADPSPRVWDSETDSLDFEEDRTFQPPPPTPSISADCANSTVAAPLPSPLGADPSAVGRCGQPACDNVQRPPLDAERSDGDGAPQPGAPTVSERSLYAATAPLSDSLTGHLSDPLPEPPAAEPCVDAAPPDPKPTHACAAKPAVLVHVHAGDVVGEADRPPPTHGQGDAAPAVAFASGLAPLAGASPAAHSLAASQRAAAKAAAKAAARPSMESGASFASLGSAESSLPGSDGVGDGSEEERKTRRGRARRALGNFKKALTYMFPADVPPPPGAPLPAGFDGYAYRVFG